MEPIHSAPVVPDTALHQPLIQHGICSSSRCAPRGELQRRGLPARVILVTQRTRNKSRNHTLSRIVLVTILVLYTEAGDVSGLWKRDTAGRLQARHPWDCFGGGVRRASRSSRVGTMGGTRRGWMVLFPEGGGESRCVTTTSPAGLRGKPPVVGCWALLSSWSFTGFSSSGICLF